MAMQMKEVIIHCEQCIQHEGTCAKAPMQPIIVTAPLELLPIDLTSIETALELGQPLNVLNVLVFCDHIMKHMMAYMTLIKLQKLLLHFC